MNYKQHHWHTCTADQVAENLDTNIHQGLSAKEVSERLDHYGENRITTKKGQSSIVRFLLQFHQPLIYILLGATIVTLLLGEYPDAAVIFAVVLINSTIGYIQETKALKAIDALSKSMSTIATVIRDSRQAVVNSVNLVPGDIVSVQPGDKIPADMRLFSVKNLQVDESALTGESVATEKKLDLVEADTLLGDRNNMGFATTVVTYGTGKGIVVSTGDRTEVGKINQSISSAEELDTPLTLKIKKFSHTLLWLILSLALFILALAYFRGESLADAFMVAVALMVGAIPEGLPAAVTIMLAIGVAQMAKRRAIIRKLVAVETLGSTNVICSDKTGTLTENQMTVQKILAGGEHFDVTGIGYKPEGKVIYEGEEVVLTQRPALRQLLRAGVLCNNSRIVGEGERWTAEGDPTEAALISAAEKAGIADHYTDQYYPRIDEVPFQSEYQYMASLHQHEQQAVVFLKGSVEAVLRSCDFMMTKTGAMVAIDLSDVQKRGEQFAAEGLRVLAFAFKNFDSSKTDVEHKDVAEGMIFIGLQGMIDPPRKEAIDAVALCQQAGIQVKMITGDHALTAATIADQLGIRGKTENGKLLALTGLELQKVSDEELKRIADEFSVFARVSPDQKLRLVKALQATGKVVAMTGDGVNDGPALKQANIGIAMGITGTEVAKDASDMVLTDDNFASIEAAVEEGRGVLDNLTKFIVWTLPTNLGEALVILASIAFATQLPLAPVQILWINMTTAVLLGLMLTFEPKELGIMDRPPIPSDKPILTFPLIMRTLLVGTLIMLSAFILFRYELSKGASLEESQTVATTVFIVLEGFYLFNCRSLRSSVRQIGWFSNKWVYYGAFAMFALQLVFIHAPVMNALFHSVPIDLNSWIRILIAGIGLFVIVSLEKTIRRKFTVSEEF
ncbi:cation-transporting P-type ATPase [Cyclobacterium jeungdonense]|uniref:Cation-transporting P-type ATPase n=1 Tax=Cyclobacterium jeungdonense TaxID=708087 RepID=A0ABT8C404_9BACT|nr:cation-transporting P-type ATPase [Cyclobacterium jeungdonense]MDN3686353.1 cation-transporting P-type ATPase [Cyclobacterium jeungdonense]